MNLNRTPDPLDRNARLGENTNWIRIEGKTKELDNRIDKIVDEVSDAAFDKVVDNSKLNWKEPVDNFNSLPSNAQNGDTRMDRSTGKVYRYDGTKWVEIQQIDAGPVNELDSRLTSQLNDIAVNIKKFGAYGDGIHDDTQAIQSAIDFVSSNGGGTVFIPKGIYQISQTIIGKTNVKIQGAGKGATYIKVPQDAQWHYVYGEELEGFSFSEITFLGGGSVPGAYASICLKSSVYCKVNEVIVKNGDSYGVLLIDCDNCEISGLDVVYPKSDGGYVTLFDGCGYCKVFGSSGKNVTMGFVIIGSDIEVDGTNDTLSERENKFATGNVVNNCSIDGHSKHAFNINASTGNTISDCISDNFNGESTFASFQNKHSSSNESKHNTFIGCIAKNCKNGFYSQRGSFVKIIGCSVFNVDINGFWINSAPNSLISDCTVDSFGSVGIYLQAATNTQVINISLQPKSGNGTTLIEIYNSSGVTLDNIKRLAQVEKGLIIDNLSNNVLIGRGVRLSGAIIEDLSNNTIYPITMQTEIDVTENTEKAFGAPQRGMQITRVRFITVKKINGVIPSIDVGTNSNSTGIVSGGIPGEDHSTLVRPEVLGNTVLSGGYIRAKTLGGATSGKVLVLVDGLELL